MQPAPILTTAPVAPTRRIDRISRVRMALLDIGQGVGHWRLWGTIGWQDIKQRYRRSVLGPFWLTLSMAIMVAALGFLYGELFNQPLHEYMPHLSLGLLSWFLISSLLTDGCQSFIASEGFIKQVKIPFSTHVCRVVWRNYIIFLHNLLVYVPIALYFEVWPGSAGLIALGGLILIGINGLWAGLLLGLFCVRFRDIPQIVTSLLQVVFFVTPIFWTPDSLRGQYVAVIDYNPFYHFIELLRAPMRGQLVTADTWIVTLTFTVAGSLLTLLIYIRFRHRIPYWV